MADVKIEAGGMFEQDGKKYMLDIRGLGGMLIGMPVHKDRNEYVACKASIWMDNKDQELTLIAKIADDDYERIGQPTKLKCCVIPLAIKKVDDCSIVTQGKIVELYYDDSNRIMQDFEDVNENRENNEESATCAKSPSVTLKTYPEVKSPSDAIIFVCDSVKEMLLEKNRKYGNSALNPCRVFSKADGVEQLKVRIDDKINRIKNEQNDEDEDVVKDLIGYLVLLVIARENLKNDESRE